MIIQGQERTYEVSNVDDIDAIIVNMMGVPSGERGEKFVEEIDILLDARNKLLLEGLL